MKLGINAIGLYPGKIGGAEQYLRNIVEKLKKRRDIQTFLFINDTAISTFVEDERLKTTVIDLNYNHNAQLSGYIQLYQIDVWFCPFFHMIPQDCNIPNVTTIFDIQQDYFPENFDKFVLSERKRLTAETVRNTDLILTISEFSKQTLMEKYEIPPERIKVTYLDADSSFSLPINPEKLEEIRRDLPKQFVLFPANMWPHKNHTALIQGFALAKQAHDLPLKLVFTGARERESRQIEQVIEACGLRNDIVYLGYLPQDDMRYVFQCASMLAFPSLFEGFGIPLVEAMASGIPIICSQSSSVPEVAGDAAILFDGNSPEEIAEAIYKVYTDESVRRELVERGRRRRTAFSWDQCAEETVGYLRSLYVPRREEPQRLSGHPLVSIVTPSYNQGQYIRATIESVLHQTYDNIEYIVMDGGSTDETVEVLREYDGRIKWVSEPDNGQADAVNKGIACAHGEIIGWLNSDDTYYPDAVEKAVHTLLSHPSFDMVYGEGDYIDRNGTVTGRYDTKMFDYQQLASECIICQPTAFFTKEIAEKAGLLNADLQMCMDYEFWIRIGKIGKILYIPERLAASRMYEENKTMSCRDAIYRECFQVTRQHYGYVPHSWLVGYATHIADQHPQLKRKYYYLFLFLKYNYSRPGYFIECLKQYLRLRKIRKSQEGQPAALPANGRYPDGWIAKEYTERLIACGNEEEIVVRGNHCLLSGEPLVLTLRVNGRTQFFPIEEAGQFTLVMPLPKQTFSEYRVKVEANRTCSPASISDSTDVRELSVQIESIFLRQRPPVEKPLVSVITPSYNQGHFIRAAIESVLRQDYDKIEYIVVDGGSTDGTLEILKEYGDRITYISEPDHGQSDALNKGFHMAAGEIVAWLNSDDVYEPGCVAKAVKAFEDSPSAALAYGNGYIIDKDGKKIRPFEFDRDFNLWALTHVWDYIMQPSAFFRADALKKVGYLREDLNWTMDWDLWVKLAMHYDVVYINDYLACSREYEATKTSTGKDRRLEEILSLMKEFTNEESPYGYEIYYCSDLLMHYWQEESRRKEVENRLTELINLQPTPDAEHKCTCVANFMVRPLHCWQALEVEVTEVQEVEADFYWNGRLFLHQSFPRGVTKVAVPQEISWDCAYLRAEIHSEGLRYIGHQRDSWVKMRLCD